MNKLPFSSANNWVDFPKLKFDPEWSQAEVNINHIQFVAMVGLSKWQLRMNNFPDKPLFTLIINGDEVIHFDDWPDFWVQPEYPKW